MLEGVLHMPWHMSKPCIKFQAGLMFLDGKMMQADNRKGLLCLYEVSLCISCIISLTPLHRTTARSCTCSGMSGMLLGASTSSKTTQSLKALHAFTRCVHTPNLSHSQQEQYHRFQGQALASFTSSRTSTTSSSGRQQQRAAYHAHHYAGVRNPTMSMTRSSFQPWTVPCKDTFKVRFRLQCDTLHILHHTQKQCRCCLHRSGPVPLQPPQPVLGCWFLKQKRNEQKACNEQQPWQHGYCPTWLRPSCPKWCACWSSGSESYIHL